MRRGRPWSEPTGCSGKAAPKPRRPPVCACGRRGCLDAYAGLPALLQAAAPDLGSHHPDDAVDRVAELARRAAAGDRRAVAGIRDVGTWLGRGASILINVLDPATLVLGGFVTSLARWILPTLESELDARVPNPARAHCRVEVSALGRDGALIGAAVAGRDHIFDNPMQITNGWEWSREGRPAPRPGP